MFGRHVFTVKKKELVFSPQPALPAYLIPEDGVVEATLLGETAVVYHMGEKRDYIPGQYTVKRMHFTYKNKNEADVDAACVAGKLERIDIWIG